MLCLCLCLLLLCIAPGVDVVHSTYTRSTQQMVLSLSLGLTSRDGLTHVNRRNAECDETGKQALSYEMISFEREMDEQMDERG